MDIHVTMRQNIRPAKLLRDQAGYNAAGANRRDRHPHGTAPSLGRSPAAPRLKLGELIF